MNKEKGWFGMPPGGLADAVALGYCIGGFIVMVMSVISLFLK